jgi:hypothetical protein
MTTKRLRIHRIRGRAYTLDTSNCTTNSSVHAADLIKLSRPAAIVQSIAGFSTAVEYCLSPTCCTGAEVATRIRRSTMTEAL